MVDSNDGSATDLNKKVDRRPQLEKESVPDAAKNASEMPTNNGVANSKMRHVSDKRPTGSAAAADPRGGSGHIRPKERSVSEERGQRKPFLPGRSKTQMSTPMVA